MAPRFRSELHLQGGLAVVGLVLSVWLLSIHYAPATHSSFCEVGEVVSCSKIQMSDYSMFLGVPVAVWGIVWFGIFLMLSFILGKHYSPAYLMFQVAWSGGGVFTVLYLWWAEYQVGAICPLCALVQMDAIAIVLVSRYVYRQARPRINLAEAAADVRWLVILVGILCGALIVSFNVGVPEPVRYSPEQLTALATCLTSKGYVMYGDFMCSNCITQKALFQDAFGLLNYVECNEKAPAGAQLERCAKRSIDYTPTWIREVRGEEESRETGVRTPIELSELSGCPLPTDGQAGGEQH